MVLLSLIGTQTVPGSPQFGFRRLRGFPRFFAEETSQGLPQKFSLFAGGASQRLSPKKTQSLSLRGASQEPPPNLNQSSLGLSHSTYIHSLSSHPSPNHPLMFCPFAAPVGLGSLDLFFFCHPVRLNSFDLLSLCRYLHISSLAPWVPMSGYTLYVFRRTVVTEIGAMRLFLTPRTQL
ncbi:hypothetical protein TNCV_1503201 [Trichonephila clavipes]|uniref:Uncharacterized protein n=1 Tax=Trichonephila clavipes TaxID=2585209 RepID=A0A8X6S1B6_TRICX|nr:hypothetical protein TNCV_1503201 [Trichonephila clavipes]